MTAILASLKSDLLGRRLLPIFILLGVALVGAVAYAVLGGGSSSQTPAATLSIPGAATLTTPPLATPAPVNPHTAVSETTTGVRYQRGGKTHNPFTPLPGSKTKEAQAPAGGSSTAPNSTGSSGSSPGSGGTTPSGSGNQNPTPTTPKKPQRTFQVALLFGLAPAPGQNPQLTPYENLTRLTPLPNKKEPLLVYSGVSRSGKAAIFTLLREAIVKGGGLCLPSPTQCEAIDIAAGQTEELQYIGALGQPVVYLLQVVSIVKSDGTSQAQGRTAKVSKVGRRLLRAAGLPVSQELRYWPARDVVVFAAPHHRH